MWPEYKNKQTKTKTQSKNWAEDPNGYFSKEDNTGDQQTCEKMLIITN